MNVIKTEIPDVLILEPKVFGDERGFFYESYNEQVFRETTGLSVHFVQDNHSRSAQGVLRGLHYQLPPKAQGKLVRVIQGEVFDVAVDIRTDSKTFGKWVGEHLSAENKRMLWIPPGFAHGFYVTSEIAEFHYKCTDYYAPDLERCIRWDDPHLVITWPLVGSPLVSNKDGQGLSFNQIELSADAYSSSGN